MATAPAYLEHYGLHEAAFSKAIADTDLWVPPTKEQTVDEVVEAAREYESVSLTGECGVGKTCVLRAVRHRLATEGGFPMTYCHNVTLGRRDFYRQLSLALSLSPSATAGALFHAVSLHVQEQSGERQHPIFVIDEAHLLHQDTLDHLPILLNYAWDSQPLLSLVLLGLPELADRLALRRNRSLFSRIARRLHIAPLTPDDTGAYIRMRMRRAGCDREVFTSDALVMMHEASAGAMRDLDRLAHAALREGARKKRRLIERDTIQRIVTS